jgi:(2Fe-2S) ferredoxin
MSYYERHVFFCLNRREGTERTCCARHDAEALQGYAKVRINKAGCLDRCEEGPCLVVYPEGTWYTYVDRDDIDEIVEEHLVHGRVVERLKI